MPVKVTSIGGGRWKVSTPSGTKARSTTKTNALKQRRLINAVEHGWHPTKRGKR